MKIPKRCARGNCNARSLLWRTQFYILFLQQWDCLILLMNGEMVYIIPRSWTSGAYFKRFRQYFLREGKLEHIHLFVSRNKVFDKEDVLQETIIIKSKKRQTKRRKKLQLLLHSRTMILIILLP